MRSTTWPTGASGATRCGHLLQRLPRLHLDHGQPVGHRRRLTSPSTPAELGDQAEPHGDQRGEQREHHGGRRRDGPPAMRCPRHHHAGAAVAHRRTRPGRRGRGPGRRRGRRARPGPTGSGADSAWIARVSRICHLSAFRSAVLRSCVRTYSITCSINRTCDRTVAANDRTAHRQISAARTGHAVKTRHASNTCLIIGIAADYIRRHERRQQRQSRAAHPAPTAPAAARTRTVP